MAEPLRRNWSEASASGLTVADECAAFLAGDYLDYIHDAWVLGRISRAAWMMLNAVAHGRPERVRELAAARPPKPGSRMSWYQSRAGVAGVLIEKSGDDDAELARLQRDALVPLELALIGETSVTPTMLVQLSLLALEVQALDVD